MACHSRHRDSARANRTCQRCGTSLPAAARFCGRCGTRLANKSCGGGFGIVLLAAAIVGGMIGLGALTEKRDGHHWEPEHDAEFVEHGPSRMPRLFESHHPAELHELHLVGSQPREKKSWFCD